MNWNKGEIKILKLISDYKNIHDNKQKLLNELKNKKLKKYIYEDGLEAGPCMRIQGNEDYFIQCRGFNLCQEDDGWYNHSEIGWMPYSFYYY